MNNSLEKLHTILEQRKTADASDSYVASLYQQGINKILEKIGEEATETILAAKDFSTSGSSADRQSLISETADLWFHSLVMLNKLGASYADVLDELDRRFGISGIDEKASRNS